MSVRQAGPGEGASTVNQRRTTQLIAVLSVLLVAVIVVWLLNDGSDDSPDDRAPEAVTPAALVEAAGSASAPIFWAGPIAGTTLELSSVEGRNYVRYLTDGAAADDPRAIFLTVGSYEFANPVAAIERLAKKPNTEMVPIPGGVAYWNKDRPTNVYLGYLGTDVQIEVFDPDPKRARELATSGEIVPVPSE